MDSIITFLQKFEPGNWISLVCSGISIIISLLIGTLNYLHVKRQFRAAFHPLIHMMLKDRECNSGICLRLHVRNMSKDKSILNGKIQLLMMNPTKPFLMNFPRWLVLLSVEGIEISPTGEFVLEDSTDKEFKSLEQFMLQKFPRFISAERISKSAFRYYLSQNKSIRLRAVAEFKSSIPGTDRMKVIANYYMAGETSPYSRQGYRLFFWKILSGG